MGRFTRVSSKSYVKGASRRLGSLYEARAWRIILIDQAYYYIFAC